MNEEKTPAGPAAAGGPGGTPKPEEARSAGPAAEAAPTDAAPAAAAARDGARGVALRVLAAVAALPWMVVYGVTGAWAVTRGARAAAQGLAHLDAGYSRMVTPLELVYVGALLLTAFAVLLACGLLLLFALRSAALWLPVLLVAAGLTAGSVWAAVSGGLHPLLWILFFFGLAYAATVALARVVQVTRAGRSARIASP